MMTLAVVVTPALATAPTIGIEMADTEACPSAEAVQSRYAELAPATPNGPPAPPGVARIAVLDGLLHVSLRSGSGALIGQRSVASPWR
jgi:hypothetical protein